MNVMMQTDETIAAVVVLVLLATFPFGIWYSTYLKMRFFPAVLLSIGTMFAAALRLHVRHGALLENSPLRDTNGQFGAWARYNGRPAEWAYLIAAGLAVGVVAKVYRAWMMDAATEAERRADKAGVRAWLSSMGIISVMGIGLCAYLALGWSILGTIVLTLMVLLSYPVANIVMASGREEVVEDTVGVEERQRVLAMVEAGKINAEEAAELISALGEKPTAASAGVRLTANRRMMAAGVILLVVGFCLPWFEVNVGAAVRDAMAKMPQQMMGFSQQVSMADGTMLTVRGGDVGHGLGWAILACGLVAGALPLMWPVRGGNGDRQKAVGLGAPAAGSVVMAYLMSGSLSTSSVGLWLAAVAYGILWVGAVREYVRPARGRVLSAGMVG